MTEREKGNVKKESRTESNKMQKEESRTDIKDTKRKTETQDRKRGQR